MIGLLAFVLYALTIPAANWLIGNVGTICIPDGPCMIPVGFGLFAPSGVLMVGAALALRDAVHSRLGVAWSVGAISIGAVLSLVVSAPALAIASVAAFVLSEIADLAVYAPLRRRNLVAAVALSGTIGAVVDSALFLWLAFGSLAHIEGQVVGKTLMSLLAAGLVAAYQYQRRARYE